MKTPPWNFSKSRKHILHALQIGIACKVHKLARPAHLYLDAAVLNGLWPDGDAYGIADQIAVVELHARTLTPIIQQYIDPRRTEFLVDLLGVRELLLHLGIDCDVRPTPIP